MAAAVVSASPLIFLAKLGYLQALEVFEPVVTTPETLKEVMAGLDTGYREALAVQAAVDAGRIDVRRAPASGAPLMGLDPGELSVLKLALTIGGATAVVDDLAAIKAARGLGLPARSTAFVLLDNVAAKRISPAKFKELLDRLMADRYFLGPRLYMRLVEESRRI